MKPAEHIGKRHQEKLVAVFVAHMQRPCAPIVQAMAVDQLLDHTGRALMRLDEILDLEIPHREVVVSGLDGAALDRLPAGVTGQLVGGYWRFQVEGAALWPVIQAVEAAQARVVSVQPIRQSLEDYFLKEMAMTGKDDRWSPED